uniref:Odorant receptor n=1 Tax=Callosobruchus chinensis TaxID=146774 RepID=A0A7G9J0X7_CALCS|nr:odorant receptor protein OR10 [Callosobruchus chinensis]
MGKLLLLVPHVAMLLNTCVGLFEFATLIYNQPKMAKLKKLLQSESFNYEECSNTTKIVEDSRAFYNRITIASYLIYWMVAVGGHLSALKNLNAESRAGRYGVNTTCYDLIPHLFVIPFQTDTTRRCKNALMVMDFGLLIIAGYIATHDTVLYSFLSCIKAKFEVVSEATITIRERTALKMHMDKHFEMLNDEEFPEFEELMYCEIKRCNANIVILIRACKDLESIFCYTLLGRSVSSLLVIAACLYIGSFLSPRDPEMYHLAEYLISGFFQMFMICYFGVFITERGAAYKTCLYESNWYSCSSRFKQAMLIMMNQMQRPLYLTIGKFFPLSLQTFVQVTKAAFSYATVLKTV